MYQCTYLSIRVDKYIFFALHKDHIYLFQLSKLIRMSFFLLILMSIKNVDVAGILCNSTVYIRRRRQITNALCYTYNEAKITTRSIIIVLML